MSRHILTPAPGVTPGIGFYLSGMDEVREQVREAVRRHWPKPHPACIPGRPRNGRAYASHRRSRVVVDAMRGVRSRIDRC